MGYLCSLLSSLGLLISRQLGWVCCMCFGGVVVWASCFLDLVVLVGYLGSLVSRGVGII